MTKQICLSCLQDIEEHEQIAILHRECNDKRVTIEPSSAESMRFHNQKYMEGLTLSELFWFHEQSWDMIKKRSMRMELEIIGK